MKVCVYCGHRLLTDAPDATLEWIESLPKGTLHVTARDVARHFGVSVQNANNRLRKLMEKGYVTRTTYERDGGGIEYEYSLVSL